MQCSDYPAAPNYRGTAHAETCLTIDRPSTICPILIHAIVDGTAGLVAAHLLMQNLAKEEVTMSKSNRIYIELVYVLMAAVMAVAIRVNLPKPSAPELVAVPCACTEI